jgi:hypothetical protein
MIATHTVLPNGNKCVTISHPIHGELYKIIHQDGPGFEDHFCVMDLCNDTVIDDNTHVRPNEHQTFITVTLSPAQILRGLNFTSEPSFKLGCQKAKRLHRLNVTFLQSDAQHILDTMSDDQIIYVDLKRRIKEELDKL